MTGANPYNYNLPVGPEMFLGRQEDVETLAHHLTAIPGDSFALIGGRRMGKTSLLEALLRELEPTVEGPSHSLLPLPIFLDLTGEGVDSVITFFRIISEEAQVELASSLALPSEGSVTLAQGQPPAPAFRRMLEQWGRAELERRGCCLRLVLLLDECEQIVEQPWAPDLYGALRYLLVGQTTRSLLKVVMTGSHRFLTQVRQQGSPLRNVLKYHRLCALGEQAARDLIIRPTEGTLPEEVVQAVVRQSGGHPFLTQYLMHHLWERGSENATPQAVQTVAAEFPHERNDFQDWLDGLGDPGAKVYRVLAQAREALTEDQIRAAVRTASLDILQTLDALCYHGLVVRKTDGEGYRIAGHMFREWFEANKTGRSDADIGEEARVSQGSERGQKGFRYDVFISYSHQDTTWVRDTLLPALERGGLRVCIDCRDFEIGVPILTNIERAVDNSRHTLLVLTPAWVESEWTEFESLLTGTADPAGRRRKLMPLMLQTCKLPGRISVLHCADFTQPQDQEVQFSRLISQLQQTAATARPSAERLPPFIAGPPVTHPRHFFGRERELKRLFNLWRHPPLQNAAIIGPRRSGKTSLLLYLKSITSTPQQQLRPGQRTDWLPQPERYRWIFVDFQDPRVGSREGLLHYLLTSLDLPVPRPCDLERCMDVMSRGLRTPTVILLDEIGVALQRYPELDDVFWEGLRALVTSQAGGNLAFVLAAHERPDQLAHHSDLSSPFFNIFGYTAVLGPLTEAQARELVASSPVPFPTADVDWVLAQSGRWPLLLQVLCRERLIALEEGETDNAWREDGLRQIEPYQYLLEVR